MHELAQSRKNKICLEDYNFKHDIENRLAMAEFSTVDLEVLEEILYSSIKVPIRKLAKTLDLEDEEILPIIEKLSKTGLFSIHEDSIQIDKDMRKYFEAQVIKFDPDFKPGMEFLQHLLKKVPISVLPVWYSIPRTSNNIFDSIVEKYLLSPQIFYRYLGELNFVEPTLTAMMHDVYQAPDFVVYAEDIVEKYGISKELFEEYVLNLEFNFVCCLCYRKVGDQWKETVTPFHEWKEYLIFLRNTDAHPLAFPQQIVRKRPHDYSFIQDMTSLLQLTKKQPIALMQDKEHHLSFTPETQVLLSEKIPGFQNGDPAFLKYLHCLVAKVRLLKLADIIDGRLYALEGASDLFDMRLENRALFLYRHPLNRLMSPHLPAQLCTERHVREAEKSIVRVLHSGWVYFDDFVKGVIVPLSEDSIVMLKRQGKTWKYHLPTYTDEELALIKATVLEWLFEIGVTAVGTHESKECFCVTPFGQSLFGR
jgi:hypothetical protein